MIANTDAIDLLKKNLQRTEMLIAAMEKIKAFNQIYQMRQTDPDFYKSVKTIQDKERIQIEQSCGEHAIISLVTAFETYYKELVQQLLSQYPKYFVSKHTAYSNRVLDLIRSNETLIYEDIERKLRLKDRFSYYSFFKAYAIPFLLQDEEELIKYLYLRRNNYVHNAGRTDSKLGNKLAKTAPPFQENMVSTEAKRLRTKLKKSLDKSYDRVIAVVKRS